MDEEPENWTAGAAVVALLLVGAFLLLSKAGAAASAANDEARNVIDRVKNRAKKDGLK